MGRRMARATARCAVVVAASLAAGGCGGGGSGWDEQAKVTGNACPPVKRVVKKAEVERALEGKVDQGRLSQYPLVLDVPACIFKGLAKERAATATFSLVEGLGDEVLEQFKEQHLAEKAQPVAGLGDEAAWFERARLLMVRKGNELVALQLFITGPQFSRYRDRSTELAEKMVKRL